jgi:hypothetical protein
MKRLLVKVVRLAVNAAWVGAVLMVPTKLGLDGSTYSPHFGFFWPGVSWCCCRFTTNCWAIHFISRS